MDGSGTPIPQTRGTPDDASETVSARWLDALQRIGRHYRLPASPQGAMHRPGTPMAMCRNKTG